MTRFAYDGNGNLVQQTLVNRVGTDNRDQVRQMAYDELNRLMRATDAEGKDTTYEHDAVGDLLRQVDPLQNAVGHTYDERNRRITTTVHLNRVTTPNRDVTTGFVYDRVGNLRETHHPNGNVVTETYDNLNRVTATTDSLGAVAAATYDARGNHLTETDANGHVTTNHFDDLDRLTRQELPEHRTVSMAYDAAGNKTSETDPRGNVRQLQYDRLNRPVKTIDPAPFAFTVEMTYDAAGNKLTEKDRRGNLTTYGYDGLNRVNHTLSAAPFRYETSATYDPAGNKLSETDRRGIATAHDYDRENRLLRTVRDGLQIAESVYDPAGNRITLYDAKRNRVDYEYDERRIETAQLAPLGATTRHTLDDMGDRVLSVDPEGRQTARVFDLRRRLHQETNGAGETTETAYDRKGNRTGVKRPKGTSWTYGYDDADRLTKVIDPLQHETDYQYDPNGNRTVQHDANGHETIFTYDELNRLATMAYPQAAGIAAHEEYGYDENGNRTRLLDALGQEIRSTFDELNRESLRNYPIPASGTGLQSIAYVYDANNNPTGVTETYAAAPQNTVYTTARTYDHFDRLAAVTDRYGKALTYSYDPNGNRSQLVDPDGKTTVYGYDALNRLTSVTIPGAAPTTYSYFKNGLLQQVTYPNGTTATYAHDLANRVQSIANQQGTVVVSSYDYHYDPNGNRSQQIEVNGGAAETTTYGFDDADRLTAVAYPDKSVAYTYDAVGNRLTERATGSQGAGLAAKTYTYDERNRLLSVSDSVGAAGLVTYTYDANGNRTSRTQNGVVTQLVYDVRDQLTEVRSNSALVESYAYDYRGLRVRKAGSGALLRYVYDDKSVLLQTDDAGNTLAKYDYGPDRLLALTHATEGRQFYLFDALGSVADLMTPGGTLQARYQYDAWGNYRHQAGSSANVFGFTGHELDAATGLYYFKARFYDPETGSFLTEDSSPGQPDTPPTLDLYLYAYANPTVYVDPTGHATEPTRVDKHRPRVLNPGEKAPPGWTVTAPDEDGTRIATPPAAPPPAPAEEEPAWYVRAWNGFLEFIGEKKVEQRVKEGVQAVQTGGKHFDEGTTKPRLDEENPAEGYNQNIKIGLKATRQVLTEDSKKVGVKAVQTGMAAGEMALNLDGARELAGALYKVTKNGVSIVVDRQAAKRLEGQGWHISEEVQSASRAKTGPGAFVPKSESMDERALEYEKAVAGGQEGKTYRVPYKNPNPRGKPHVDFDGVAPTGAPIDAKVAIVTRQKTVNQAMRQAEALRQNGAKGIWKVPDLREARRAKEVLRRAGAQDTIIVVVEKP